MTYIPNIPLSTDDLSVSQGQILGNFQSLEPVTEGVINFTPQTVPPTPTGFDIMFSMINALTAKQELYLQDPSGNNIPFTASGVVGGIDGWTYLPSGLLIKWGIVAAGLAPQPFTVSFPTAASIPVFTTCYIVFTSITGTAIDANSYVQLVGIPTPTNFQVYSAKRVPINTPQSNTFNFLAIGR